jgi:hypothetical protein
MTTLPNTDDSPELHVSYCAGCTDIRDDDGVVVVYAIDYEGAQAELLRSVYFDD